MKEISLAAFQARQRGLRDELEDLIPEPAAPEPEQSDEEAELEEALQDARDFLELPGTATRDQVQACFAADIHAFSEFFFAHYHVDEETGEAVEQCRAHRDLLEVIEQLARRRRTRGSKASREEAFAVPREHGKSVTLMKGFVWMASNAVRKFLVFFTHTDPQAAAFLADIRAEVETNTRLQAVYPEFCTFAEQPRSDELALGNGTRMVAAGKGRATRGLRRGRLRPDFVGIDDIDKDEQVNNPQLRKKLEAWLSRVVKKLGFAAVYLYIGTILHAESFLARRIDGDERRVYRALEAPPAQMKLWEAWEKVLFRREVPHFTCVDGEWRQAGVRIRTQERRAAAARVFYERRKADMDAGALVLWPAKFDLYGLMVERAEDFASFRSERQNDPFDPAGCYFPEESLKFLGPDELPPLSDVVASVGFWDPSRGTAKGDTSALPRVDALADGRRLVSWAVVGRIPPEQVIETAIGQHRQRPFTVLCVERVGLSSYDVQLQEKAKGLGIALPVEPVTPTGDKHTRIKSQRPLVMSGTLVFAASLPKEAREQIQLYPQHPNDDLWDAVQQANRKLDDVLVGVAPAAASREPSLLAGELTAEDAFGRGRLSGESDAFAPRLGARGGDAGALGGFFSNLVDRMFG
ncbi:hypothetical protein [Longimicrobium sp.]|uniref:hypothetical protein n=1 Tax=Longimicrobium sp. TaxID=2029185 RepID=UPI002E2FF313|nr:hypothetical protein [Longimicrobium sp.]HEX6039132.1 hypothetical protein [Longimicrobium sp.]